MGFFDSVKNKAGTLAADAERAGKVTAAQARLMVLQSDLKKAERELGHAALSLIERGDLDHPELAHAVERVRATAADVSAKEREIAELRGEMPAATPVAASPATTRSAADTHGAEDEAEERATSAPEGGHGPDRRRPGHDTAGRDHGRRGGRGVVRGRPGRFAGTQDDPKKGVARPRDRHREDAGQTDCDEEARPEEGSGRQADQGRLHAQEGLAAVDSRATTRGQEAPRGRLTIHCPARARRRVDCPSSRPSGPSTRR